MGAWGLVPYWCNKPFKELRLATFNARVETVATKPFFRSTIGLSGDMGVDALLEWREQHGKLAAIAQALGIKAA